MRPEAGAEEERQARMTPHVESVVADGAYEVVEQVRGCLDPRTDGTFASVSIPPGSFRCGVPARGLGWRRPSDWGASTCDEWRRLEGTWSRCAGEAGRFSPSSSPRS
jgi:hypothetical protein